MLLLPAAGGVGSVVACGGSDVGGGYARLCRLHFISWVYASTVQLSAWRAQVYAAAKSMLGSSKLPVRMAGVSLAAALYAAEGATAKDELGVEDMESRIKSQVSL